MTDPVSLAPVVAKRRAAAALALLLTAGACGSDISDVQDLGWPSDPDGPATTTAGSDGRDVRRTPTAEHPLRVASIGDSVAFDADPGIRAALESTGRAVVVNRSYGGVGLLRPQFDGYLAETMDGNPEVVVVMLGGWDLGEALAEPAGYRRRVDQVLDVLVAEGVFVVWLGMPPTPPDEGLEEARVVINELFEEAAAERPDIDYRSTDALLGGPDGRFRRVLPGLDNRPAQVRKVREGHDDGHLCPAGAALIGDLVYAAVGSRHPLPRRAAGWWRAGWTGDERYDDPPGGCSTGGSID